MFSYTIFLEVLNCEVPCHVFCLFSNFDITLFCRCNLKLLRKSYMAWNLAYCLGTIPS